MFSLLVRMAWEDYMEKKHTTASGEDYLEAILVLQKKLGMVRSVDVARHMGFTKPSITHAIRTSKENIMAPFYRWGLSPDNFQLTAFSLTFTKSA